MTSIQMVRGAYYSEFFRADFALWRPGFQDEHPESNPPSPEDIIEREGIKKSVASNSASVFDGLGFRAAEEEILSQAEACTFAGQYFKASCFVQPSCSCGSIQTKPRWRETCYNIQTP